MSNIPCTNLEKLSRLIGNKDYEAALPTSLADSILNQIGRDLRVIELSQASGELKEAHLSSVVYLILHLVRERMEEKDIDASTLTISNRSLHQLVELYQYFVEREIVARVTGIRCENDAHEFLNAIDMKISALPDEEK